MPDKFVTPTEAADELVRRLELDRHEAFDSRDPVLGKDPVWLDQATAHALMDVAFRASLTAEEGRLNHISMTLFTADTKMPSAWNVISIEPCLLEPDRVAKLSGCVEKNGATLLVRPRGTLLEIFGIAHPPPWRKNWRRDRLFRFLVASPGEVVVQRGQTLLLRYRAGIVRPMQRDMFFGQNLPGAMSNIIAQCQSNFGGHETFGPEIAFRLLHAVSSTRHGGMVCVLDKDDSCPYDVSYKLTKPIDLAELAYRADRVDGPTAEDARSFPDELRSTLELLGGASTVDGSVLLTTDLSVQGFGVRLPATERLPSVRNVGPDGLTDSLYSLSQKGTRHKAGALFVGSSESRIAFVASRDANIGAFVGVEGHLAYWPIEMPGPWVEM